MSLIALCVMHSRFIIPALEAAIGKSELANRPMIIQVKDKNFHQNSYKKTIRKYSSLYDVSIYDETLVQEFGLVPYYFIHNHLWPRDLLTSLGHQARQATSDAWLQEFLAWLPPHLPNGPKTPPTSRKKPVKPLLGCLL